MPTCTLRPVSPSLQQAKQAVDLLLDAFDDATEAGDRRQMAAVLERLRPTFAAYQQACGASGTPVDPRTIADCRAASEAVRTGAVPSPAPSRPPAPAPAPARRPMARTPEPPRDFEDLDEPDLGYTGTWAPPEDEDEVPVRRPAPAPPAPRRPPALDDFDEPAASTTARRGSARRPEGVHEPREGALLALVENKKLLYGGAAVVALLVCVGIYNPIVAVLIAAAIVIPGAILMRRSKSPASGAPSGRRPSRPARERDEDWDDEPARRRR